MNVIVLGKWLNCVFRKCKTPAAVLETDIILFDGTFLFKDSAYMRTDSVIVVN